MVEILFGVYRRRILGHTDTQRLGREVNPVVLSKAAFQVKHREHDRFVSRVAKEPKIFLIGDARDFEKLAEDRAA